MELQYSGLAQFQKAAKLVKSGKIFSLAAFHASVILS